jgi:ribosomal peptide maturation radical SAM protein 1
LEAPIDVALVVMPFGQIRMPSLGLSLLKAGLTRVGFTSRIFYFTFPFALRIGVGFYEQVSDGFPARTDLVGEWIFNGALFPGHKLDVEGYIRDVIKGESSHHRVKRAGFKGREDLFVENVLSARNQVDDFLKDSAQRILSSRPTVVGLTSMFQEHVAALSLAKRLKQLAPDLFIVLGGSNCEGPMGLETFRQFDFLDAVVSGEADLILPELVSSVVAKTPIRRVEGLFLRDSANPCPEKVSGGASVSAAIANMDALPFPDFDDFFTDARIHGFDDDPTGVPVYLAFETARGCWWGAINHCTFCGLNGSTMHFRSKSPARAMEELTYLIERYPGHPVAVSDNILDHQYLKTFVRDLKARGLGVKLFYEVKANLRKEHVRLLKEAGIDRIQPGIESFSSKVLKAMRKGVTGIQNVQLLKWCRELGVTPVWGILWGFPHEESQEYSHMAKLVRSLYHLTPPSGIGPIRLDRFSPNHVNARSMGFADVAPFPAYKYVFPLQDSALSSLAYFFSYSYARDQNVESYTRDLIEAVDSWVTCHPKSCLFHVEESDALLIWDFRPPLKRLHVLTGSLREAYLACDTASILPASTDTGLESGGNSSPATELCRSVDKLVEAGLMMREGSQYLALSVNTSDFTPSLDVLRELAEVIGCDSENLCARVASANNISSTYVCCDL